MFVLCFLSPFFYGGRVESGRVGSVVGSSRVESGRVESGRVGSGRVGSGRVGWGASVDDLDVWVNRYVDTYLPVFCVAVRALCVLCTHPQDDVDETAEATYRRF